MSRSPSSHLANTSVLRTSYTCYSVALRIQGVNDIRRAPPAPIQYPECMKTITVSEFEPVYADFREHAKKMDRPTSELIREAMEE